ncbi:MAG TPA: tol-pal system protein YbgF [Steroidobacteraceae bacterium]|jgi:tol-pal system protein YbgF
MSPPPRRWLSLVIAALALAGCESTPAQPDPTAVKLNDVDERLGRVEHVNQGLLQLSQRLDAIEAQMRQLRGELEELQNSNDMLRKQQRDLYADLDHRLAALQTAGAKGAAPGATDATGASASGAAGADAGGDQAAYARAFEALKSTDYASAIARFRDLLHAYPQSPLAGNAQYWLGEAYYVTHDYDNAAASFRAVGEQYAQSPKVPDALLKLGLTQIDQKKPADARATLKQVLQRFPGTDAARLAASRLQSLPPDEH